MALDLSDIQRLGPDAKAQIVAKAAVDLAKKQSKYGNVKTPRTMENGTEYTFDSKREAARFDELMLLLKAGKVRNLKLQPHYTLIAPCILPNGEKVKREEYVADFEYEEIAMTADLSALVWVPVVEDVKGKRTDMYLRKRNQMLDKYGITVREV